MVHGQDYEIRRNLVARAFDTRHVGPTLGYSVIDVRQKLHEQYLGLSGPEIVALKKKGVEITRRLEVPLVSYMGDTARSNYSELPHVRDSKVLLIECTFFEDDHLRRARLGKHLHVTDLPEVLEGMRNEKVVLTHVTRRTFMAEARHKLKQVLKKEQLEKVVFLMGKKQVEED
jgi:ribonuclease Z